MAMSNEKKTSKHYLFKLFGNDLQEAVWVKAYSTDGDTVSCNFNEPLCDWPPIKSMATMRKSGRNVKREAFEHFCSHVDFWPYRCTCGAQYRHSSSWRRHRTETKEQPDNSDREQPFNPPSQNAEEFSQAFERGSMLNPLINDTIVASTATSNSAIGDQLRIISDNMSLDEPGLPLEEAMRLFVDIAFNVLKNQDETPLFPVATPIHCEREPSAGYSWAEVKEWWSGLFGRNGAVENQHGCASANMPLSEMETYSDPVTTSSYYFPNQDSNGPEYFQSQIEEDQFKTVQEE